MAYFERLATDRFQATDLTEGAWDTATQHIAPAMGLLTHAIEGHRAKRRADDFAIGRISYDVLGVVPIDAVDVDIEVLRPGRTIELVEAVLSHDDRAVLRLRAWLIQPHATAHVEGTNLPRIAQAHTMEPWNPSSVWPGSYIASLEIRRDQVEPGRARFWARSSTPLIGGEDVSEIAYATAMFDLANGMTARVDPQSASFPNIDLTAHLFASPRGNWIGFDTTVSFGPGGVGLTHSVLHDVTGPIGTLSQILTVRPRQQTRISDAADAVST